MWQKAAIVLVCFGLVGCDTIPAGDLLPDTSPPVSCFSTYFNPEIGAGFNPPAGTIGPIVNPISLNWRAKWRWLANDALAVGFTAWPARGVTVEEVAAEWATMPQTWPVVTNGPIRLNSGQPGWVIGRKSGEHPNDLMRVKTILVWDDMCYIIDVWGSTMDGTYNYEYLLGIGRTLCVE